MNRTGRMTFLSLSLLDVATLRRDEDEAKLSWYWSFLNTSHLLTGYDEEIAMLGTYIRYSRADIS